MSLILHSGPLDWLITPPDSPTCIKNSSYKKRVRIKPERRPDGAPRLGAQGCI